MRFHLSVIMGITKKYAKKNISSRGREYETSYPSEKAGDTALCEKTFKKWYLEFASFLGDYLTFICLSNSFLIVNPLILQNTFWSNKILVSVSTIFTLFSHRVAMSLCGCVVVWFCAIGCSFFRPLIGPQVT